MASLNRVMLIGRLTDNPDPPRTLPNSGNTVVKFRFAVGRSRKNPQTGQWENDPNPLYIDCEVFHRQDTRRDLCSLISQYTRKGSQLYIEGRLQLDTWEDKNGGGKRSKHKIVVDSVELLDKAADSGGGGGYAQADHDDMNGPSGSGRSTFTRGGAPRQNSGYAPPEDMDDGRDQSDGDIPF
jgi:single-strand DNA-binding protein